MSSPVLLWPSFQSSSSRRSTQENKNPPLFSFQEQRQQSVLCPYSVWLLVQPEAPPRDCQLPSEVYRPIKQGDGPAVPKFPSFPRITCDIPIRILHPPTVDRASTVPWPLNRIKERRLAHLQSTGGMSSSEFVEVLEMEQPGLSSMGDPGVECFGFFGCRMRQLVFLKPVAGLGV